MIYRKEVFHVSDSSQVDARDISKVFKVFDTNGDGFVSTKEFRQAAISLGFDPSGDELAMLVNQVAR